MRNRLVLTVTFLAACKLAAKPDGIEVDGGVETDGPTQDGGDAGDPDAAIDASPDAAPDLTAPALLEVSPAPGSVWLHAPIRLTFDEDLADSSATASTVSVTLAGESIAATVALEGPRTLAITLAPATRGVGDLAVHVSPMVADLAGNVMTTPIDLALTAPAWSSVPVDRGPALSAPSYVVGPSGTVIAAWLVSTQLGKRAVVSELVGTTWRAIGSELGIADPTSVSLALDEAGIPLIAVTDLGVAHVARWNGTSWSELASPGNGSAIAIATPPGGHPIALVVSDSTVAVRELINGAWQSLGTDIMLGSPLACEPSLATPSPGKAVVGWVDAAAQLRVYRLDTDWTALAPIAVSTGSRMSVTARGSAIAVAYDAWAGSYGVIAATASGAATTWTQLGKPLDIDIAGDARGPAIALDSSGMPLVAWTELVETAQRGALARWSGSAWTIVGGTSWLTSTSAAPAGAKIVLGPGDAPVVATLASSGLVLARFNGPRIAAIGMASRPSLAGCSFDPAAPPSLLSQTGCFDLGVAAKPVAHAGLVPYDVVAELWSDGAKKRRWIALPAGATMTLGSTGAWMAPVGAFMVKEFALETTPGNPSTRRPVETRFLVNDATNGWQGFSYRWNTQGTDATLQPDTVNNVAWQMDDGSQHTHQYPSRAHCRSCHYASSGPLLGLRPEQLARWYDYDGTIADQPATLAALGIVTPVTPPAFTAPHDPSAGVEPRMRGYMAANCSHCHNPQYINIKDLRYATPLSSTKLCEVITPGSPSQSVVYQKVTSRPGMPALGTLAVDPFAQDLLGRWITGMTSCP